MRSYSQLVGLMARSSSAVAVSGGGFEGSGLHVTSEDADLHLYAGFLGIGMERDGELQVLPAAW